MCGVVHRLGRLGQQRRGGPRVVAVGGQAVGEVAAGDQLHGEVALAVVLAHLVDRHDAGVVEQRHRLGLVLEPPQLVVAGQDAGADHLEGDGAVEADLAGAVDDAHAAAAELGVDLVVAEVADRCPAAGRPAWREWPSGSALPVGYRAGSEVVSPSGVGPRARSGSTSWSPPTGRGPRTYRRQADFEQAGRAEPARRVGRQPLAALRAGRVGCHRRPSQVAHPYLDQKRTAGKVTTNPAARGTPGRRTGRGSRRRSGTGRRPSGRSRRKQGAVAAAQAGARPP